MLHIVATPIGNLGDLTPRARDALLQQPVAEDRVAPQRPRPIRGIQAQRLVGLVEMPRAAAEVLRLRPAAGRHAEDQPVLQLVVGAHRAAERRAD